MIALRRAPYAQRVDSVRAISGHSGGPCDFRVIQVEGGPGDRAPFGSLLREEQYSVVAGHARAILWRPSSFSSCGACLPRAATVCHACQVERVDWARLGQPHCHFYGPAGCLLPTHSMPVKCTHMCL